MAQKNRLCLVILQPRFFTMEAWVGKRFGRAINKKGRLPFIYKDLQIASPSCIGKTNFIKISSYASQTLFIQLVEEFLKLLICRHMIFFFLRTLIHECYFRVSCRRAFQLYIMYQCTHDRVFKANNNYFFYIKIVIILIILIIQKFIFYLILNQRLLE